MSRLRRHGEAAPGPGAVSETRAAVQGPGASYLADRARQYGWPLASSLPPLGPVDTAPACGRDHARAVLEEWQLGHLADDAALLVSELMTNAVQASQEDGTPVGLRLLADGGQLIIEVWDCAPGHPLRRRAGDRDEDGRGLRVVEALSHRTGCVLASGWKVVWCELRFPAPSRDR